MRLRVHEKLALLAVQKPNNRCATQVPGVLSKSNRWPIARIVVMKKPKKTAAAKPRSAGATRRRVKAGVKSLKAKPGAAAKKTAARKNRKVTAKTAEAAPAAEAAPVAKPKPATPPKLPEAIKREAKAEPVSETKPKPIAPKKTTATAKSAPKSPLFDIDPLAKLISPGARKLEASAKSLPKPPERILPKPEPFSPEPPEEEKPEMGVELIFEKKKAPPKPRAKTKRVTKPKVIAAPPPAETKPADQPKPTAAKPASIPKPPETKQSSRPARKAPAKIPAILLEGDKPEPAPVSGPGHRYALGPKPPVEKMQTEGELPESYGTGTIMLTARDPHWLYTHWDLSSDEQRRYNGFSRDGHLIVRIYVDAAGGKLLEQIVPGVGGVTQPEPRDRVTVQSALGEIVSSGLACR